MLVKIEEHCQMAESVTPTCSVEIIECKRLEYHPASRDGKSRYLVLSFWNTLDALEEPEKRVYEKSVDLYLIGDSGKTLDHFRFHAE